MGIAKVTRNYQVTIPRDIRRIKDIKVGDTILFAVEGERIDFLKMERNKILDELAGSWKGKIKENSVEYVRKMRTGWKKRTERLEL